MRTSAVLVLIAAGALAPRVAAQPEVVPDRPSEKAPSKRELRLQQAVDDMVELVERYSGLEFPEQPVVRAAKPAEWRETVKRELGLESGREVFEMSLSMFGLYLPASQEVVLSPLVVTALIRELADDAPRHRRDGVAHQKATVVHEIVHALQEMHFQLPTKLMAAEEDDEIRRYKYLIEGHAVFVEERVAELELGLESFMARGPYGGLGSIGADPSYATGRNYFVHVFRTEGMAGVLDRLREPPTFDAIVELARQPLPPAPLEPAADAEDGDAPRATKGAAGEARRKSP